MAYVDLNPIRANISKTPEASDFTSVQARIRKTKLAGLIEFDTEPIDMLDLTNKKLPFTLTEYLELVDWSGRIMRADKTGYISPNTPPILDRLKIDPDLWAEHLCGYKDKFHTVIGPVAKVKQYCQKISKSWVWGMKTNTQFYSRPS